MFPLSNGMLYTLWNPSLFAQRALDDTPCHKLIQAVEHGGDHMFSSTTKKIMPNQ